MSGAALLITISIFHIIIRAMTLAQSPGARPLHNYASSSEACCLSCPAFPGWLDEDIQPQLDQPHPLPSGLCRDPAFYTLMRQVNPSLVSPGMPASTGSTTLPDQHVCQADDS